MCFDSLKTSLLRSVIARTKETPASNNNNELTIGEESKQIKMSAIVRYCVRQSDGIRTCICIQIIFLLSNAYVLVLLNAKLLL